MFTKYQRMDFMNIYERDIISAIANENCNTQRELSDRTGYSIGIINRSLHSLQKSGYIEDGYKLTDMAWKEVEKFSPNSAVILAAGYGNRMVPINRAIPKALLEVRGERLIDRLIEQLQAVDIKDITVVTGFLQEQFEYLIDKYGIELVVNREYATSNNLHSLSLASSHICNTYIVPCDIWC